MKIVLAYDGSENSASALESVAARPWPAPLAVTVILAFDLRSALAAHVGAPAQTEPYAAVLAQGRAAAELRVAQARDKLLARLPDADVRAYVIEGPPAETIVTAASQHEADLIIMGARGHGAIARALLGSVSSSVATRAHCAVEVVRTPSGGAPPGCRLLLATDLSAPAAHAIEWVRSMEWPQETQVRLVTAIPPLQFLSSAETGGHEVLRELALAKSARRDVEIKQAELREAFAAKFGAAAVSSEIVDGDPRDVLVDVAARWPASLVVLGSHGRTGQKRLLLGSVAHDVLHTAPCAVHIAR